MIDTLLQRKNMVESQVRPSDITDRRITAAMSAVARERFVPPNVASLAYMDEVLQVVPGRALMAPRPFARLAQLAGIEPVDKVLVVGGWGGYTAAVLARLAKDVVVVDVDPEATRVATAAFLDGNIQNATAVTGPLASGWPIAAPYDVIFIEGAVEAVPGGLIEQLATGGRLVVVERDRGIDRAVRIVKSQTGITRHTLFEAAAPLLPGFQRVAAGFQF